MLTIEWRAEGRYCDGVARRQVLRIGAAGVAGLTLSRLLRAEQHSGRRTARSLINVHLGGGPAHQDSFDLKPGAPVPYRGEFRPIPTNVAGIDICEHLPRLTQRAHRLAIVRSVVGAIDEHSDQQTRTGYVELFPRRTDRPALGSVVDRLLGPSPDRSLAFVSLGFPTRMYDGGVPGYLGAAHAPLRPDSGLQADDLQVHPPTLSADRLRRRTALLASIDQFRRALDAHRSGPALDPHVERALEIILSGRVADALDLSRVDEATRDRYGPHGLNFLRALRLATTGVRVINFTLDGWDAHEQIFPNHRTWLSRLDRGLSALIDDLDAQRLDRDVAVVVWGEFGRAPRVNGKAGREHWPRLSMAVLTGGGFRLGQVIGASTSRAEEVKERPVHFQEVHATLYRHLGIDPSETLIDASGRTRPILDHCEPIGELL
jgi:hypothetical protein